VAGERERQQALERLQRDFRLRIDSVDLDSPDYFVIIQQMTDEWRSISATIDESYPLDVPNAECHHAVLTGIGFENQTWKNNQHPEIPTKGDRFDFFRFGPEMASLWTHMDDDYTVLLVEVDPVQVPSSLWRTLATSMSVSIGLASMQEHAQTIDYAWIYRFKQRRSISEQNLLGGEDPLILSSRTLERVGDWFQRAPILELLLRDETFFVASQLVCDSFRNHWFCLACALRPPERRPHDHPEPDPWSIVAKIPAMESAIVQATRAAEALLGKPGSNRTRTKQRWIERIPLDPDATFDLAGKSYFDFYYDLFDVRNDSAHSYGTFSAKLTRSIAVSAQTFAHSIIRSLFDRRACSHEEALQRLSFNKELLTNIDPGMSTPLTARSGRLFPPSS
jgi:hypothetical protein